MEVNKIYNENCLNTMQQMPDNFVDLIITSPPYDNLRDYQGYSFDFENIAKEIYRVIKNGAILVWIVGDQTKNFCESLTAFKQAIFFVEEIGFNLLDTMIYAKKSYAPAYPNIKRYASSFEYMFILSKGKPNTFNGIKVKKQNSSINKKLSTSSYRLKDGNLRYKKVNRSSLVKTECNVWVYDVGYMKSSKDKISFKHPATFPEELVEDHILSWSNENDLVYDPMGGSGTLPKMAKLNHRNYIMSEISKEYCNIAQNRILKGV